MGTNRYEEEKTTNRILIAGSFKNKMLCIFLNRPLYRIVNMLIFPVAHKCILLHCKNCVE